MKAFASITRRFLSDDSATTAIEYALIATGIAGAIIATLTLLSGNLVAMWTSVKDAFG